MGISIKPSDLKYKYPKDVVSRDVPKFCGKPDPASFNRDDLYEILPLLEAVMDELGRDDGCTLHLIEDLMNRDLPRSIVAREEVFDFLVGCTREIIAEP